jgi:hypothetical protein
MTMKNRATLLFLLATSPVAALAGGPLSQMDPQEMQALRTYCMADVQRLCAGVQPGGGRIKACLMANKEQMSVGCAEALQKLKKAKQ